MDKEVQHNNPNHYEYDLTDFKELENNIKKVKPDIIIHTAAIVDVDFL